MYTGMGGVHLPACIMLPHHVSCRTHLPKLACLTYATVSFYPTCTCRCHVSTTEVRRHVSSMSKLETLQFHFTDLSSDCCLAAMLGNLSNLRTLKTPETEAVTAELASQVVQLTALQDLDLSSEYVSCISTLQVRERAEAFFLVWQPKVLSICL